VAFVFYDRGGIIHFDMEEHIEKASEFAQALYESGYDFEAIAERQSKMAKTAGRFAVAWSVLGIAFLGAAGYSCAKEPRSRLIFELPMESIIISGAFLYARDEVQRARLMQLGRQNSNELTEIAGSAKRADLTGDT
jgi:hypothetical protein